MTQVTQKSKLGERIFVKINISIKILAAAIFFYLFALFPLPQSSTSSSEANIRLMGNNCSDDGAAGPSGARSQEEAKHRK